jgi:hypothetical protein
MSMLLQRQADLLRHLTSAGVIFGDAAECDAAPPGLDRAMLRLEAVFSHEKRMEKVAAVYPRTLKLLGDRQAAIIRGFTAACPPAGISRLDNAVQFFEFLLSLWEREPAQPEHLRDVAACECAFAQARVREGAAAPASVPDETPAVRRHPQAVLERCRHDVRPVFEGADIAAPVARRETRLAIAVPPGAEHPQVFELPPAVFDLVESLSDWTDRRAFGAAPEMDALFDALAQHGVVEARP